MKSKIVETGVKSTKRFPLVAKTTDSGTVVLFSSEHIGTILIVGSVDTYKLGESHSDWASCLKCDTWQILDSVTITFES